MKKSRKTTAAPLTGATCAVLAILIMSSVVWAFGPSLDNAAMMTSQSESNSVAVPPATAGQLSALKEPNPEGSQEAESPSPFVCASAVGERQHCPADTTSGVLLVQSTGSVACLLGKNWGYDDTGVWVSDGCSGEFAVGSTVIEGTANPAPDASSRKAAVRVETWGEFDPGDGFVVGRTNYGELDISAYALVRFIDQTPSVQDYTDHLGNEHAVDPRNDIWSHRIMIFFKGWLGNPKLIYNLFLWTVNTTDQRAVFGSMGYQFSRKFSLYGGINGLPGTRSLQGSHPYWLANDRVMADEFFRPYFTMGIWVTGEITPGLWYNAMIGNNLSTLGVKATQLDRKYGSGFSFWWMPTTKEFGPKGAYGDWEGHEKIATRFGISTSFSPEQRFTDAVTGDTGSTVLKLADSQNVFSRGALAPDVAVQTVNYKLLSFDAGMKYKGFFLQTEIYNRWLDNFVADGPLPVNSLHDSGFYVQGAFYPIPKRLELYGATSWIFGDKSAGFKNAYEYIGGGNFYFFNSRNYRVNAQVINVHHSAVGSTFGYYTAGQDGTTLTSAFSIFF